MRSIMFVDNMRVKVRKLWEAVFGDEVKVDEPVKKIEGLPSATSEDAGKSVVVDSDGKWKLGEAGGGDMFVARFSSEWVEEEEVFHCDKTYAEVMDAFIKGTLIVGADQFSVITVINPAYNNEIHFIYTVPFYTFEPDVVSGFNTNVYILNADNSVEYKSISHDFTSD